MSQPPDDFYGSSTDITELPPQEDFPQSYPPKQPDVEQLAFPAPDPLKGPLTERPGLPPQNQESQPGFNAAPQPFPQQSPFGQPGQGAQRPPQRGAYPQSQGPASQPGFEQPGPSRGPISQPGSQVGSARLMDQRGPGPQNVASRSLNDQGKRGQQQPSFPPPSGPISQPGFSPVEPSQTDQRFAQQPSYPGSNAQSGDVSRPWEQRQPNVSARSPQQAGLPPWQPQQPGSLADWPTVAQPQQANALADWPTVAQPQTPTKPKRSTLMLVVALVALVLLVLGSGTFVLFSQKSNSTGSTPPPKTAISNGSTPVATHPVGTPTGSSGGLHSINTPVQGGTDWLVTLTGARTTTASLIAPNVGKTYLEIQLTLKNTSSKTLTVISIIEFTLTDASGHRYNETATDTNIRRPPDGNINANQTLDAQLAYEVPVAQHSFVLTFAYGLSSGSGASIAWKFTA